MSTLVPSLRSSLRVLTLTTETDLFSLSGSTRQLQVQILQTNSTRSWTTSGMGSTLATLDSRNLFPLSISTSTTTFTLLELLLPNSSSDLKELSPLHRVPSLTSLFPMLETTGSMTSMEIE
jgi:hypothetical protein